MVDDDDREEHSIDSDVEESETGYSTGTGSSSSILSASSGSKIFSTESEDRQRENEPQCVVATIVSDSQQTKKSYKISSKERQTTSHPIEKKTEIFTINDSQIDLKSENQVLPVCDQTQPLSPSSLPPIDSIDTSDSVSRPTNAAGDVTTSIPNASATSDKSKSRPRTFKSFSKWIPLSSHRQNEQQKLTASQYQEHESDIDSLQYKSSKNQNGTSPSKTDPTSDFGNTTIPDQSLIDSELGVGDKTIMASNEQSQLIAQQLTRQPFDNNNIVSTDQEVQTYMRSMLYVLTTLLVFTCFATIGTSYLGATLAQMGQNDYMSNPPLNTTTPQPIITPTTLQPVFPAPSPCSNDDVLLSLEIIFDSKPAEVGISLRDSTSITNNNLAIWTFEALSFRSFTQFQRKNNFSICISKVSNYELEVTDTSSNGLVSIFGSSSTVFGNWSITLDSKIVASYFGDCNSTPNEAAAAMNEPVFFSCGNYCRCSFIITTVNKLNFTCETNC